MGLLKHAAMEQEERHSALVSEMTDVAVEAEVFARCEFHECVWETGQPEEDAYTLAEDKFSRGELRNDFRSRQELRDAVRDAIQDAYWGGCPHDCPNSPGWAEEPPVSVQ